MRRSVAWCLALASLSGAPHAGAQHLPFEKRVLPNGLTVISHEDHALPVVAVQIVYRVGSRDEQAHRTGFAHLFEHLMFMGTKRVPANAFDVLMEQVGATNNAWTSNDWTVYHETGHSGALELFLYLEADRLEALGTQINEEKLAVQRDVVRNERRQSIENVPYAKSELRLPELLYPVGHPYHHPVIGSHEDLEAATVADVRAFFRKYYVPSNACLVVAGDVTHARVQTLAEKYFGQIPAGARPERRQPEPVRDLGRVVRETLHDNVELPKVVMAFHSPAHFAPGDAELDLLAELLASGKASRLYKRLVFEKRIAQDVSAHQDSAALAGRFVVQARAKPGGSAEALEEAIDKVLEELLVHGPSDEEVERAKNAFEFAFISHLQSVEQRAKLLGLYEVETGNPGFVRDDLDRYRRATTASVHHWAKATVKLGSRVVLHIVPGGAKK